MGDGYFDDGKFHLTVTFTDFIPDSDVFLEWQAAFELASQLLFNATQGQMQLGKLWFKNNGGLNKKHDIFLYNTPDKKSQTDGWPPWGPFEGRMRLQADERNKPFVIVHEFGHYAFDLGDEYFREHPDDPSEPRCIVDPFVNGACIMEYSWKVAALAGVSEFCVSDNHDDTADHSHNDLHPGLSCWEVIKDNYKDDVTIPEGVPTQQQPEGHEMVQWELLSILYRYMFVLIGSAEFDGSSTEKAIRNYLKFHVEFLSGTGHSVGIVSNLTPLQPVVELGPVDDNNFKGIIDAIDDLNLTAEEQAEQSVQTALDALTSGKQTSDVQALVLITPGQSAKGLQSPTRDDLNFQRVWFPSTSVGTGNVNEFLQAIAGHKRASTLLIDEDPNNENAALGLQGHNIEQVFELSDGYSMAGFRAGRLLARDDDDLAPRATFDERLPLNFEYRETSFDYPVHIDEGSDEVWFLLTQMPSAQTAFVIFDPAGERINPENSIGKGAIMWQSISTPAAGRWMMRLQRTGGKQAVPFRMMAFCHTPELVVHFFAEAQTGSVRLYSQSSFPDPLVHLEQTAEIFRSSTGNAEDSEKVAHVVMQPAMRRANAAAVDGDAFAPASSIGNVALASGNYQADVQLQPGIYTAVLRSANAGAAVAASNPDGVPHGNLAITGQPPVPNFVRFYRLQFIVTE